MACGLIKITTENLGQTDTISRSFSQSQPWGVMEILRVKRYVGPWKSLAKPRSKGESLNPPPESGVGTFIQSDSRQPSLGRL